MRVVSVQELVISCVTDLLSPLLTFKEILCLEKRERAQDADGTLNRTLLKKVKLLIIYMICLRLIRHYVESIDFTYYRPNRIVVQLLTKLI